MACLPLGKSRQLPRAPNMQGSQHAPDQNWPENHEQCWSEETVAWVSPDSDKAPVSVNPAFSFSAALSRTLNTSACLSLVLNKHLAYVQQQQIYCIQTSSIVAMLSNCLQQHYTSCPFKINAVPFDCIWNHFILEEAENDTALELHVIWIHKRQLFLNSNWHTAG